MTAAFWEQHSSGHHMIHPLHLQSVTRKQNVLLRRRKIVKEQVKIKEFFFTPLLTTRGRKKGNWERGRVAVEVFECTSTGELILNIWAQWKSGRVWFLVSVSDMWSDGESCNSDFRTFGWKEPQKWQTKPFPYLTTKSGDARTRHHSEYELKEFKI